MALERSMDALMTSRVARALCIFVVVTFGCQAPNANAQAPETENGRYTLAPLPDGSFVRLDTRSGAVSKCANAPSGWECRVLPDERAALDAEIGRLQADNESIRSKLAEASTSKRSDKSDGSVPKGDSLAPTVPHSPEGDRKIEIPLPSDRDVDRVMGLIERAWRRLMEMAGRLQRDSSGKI